MNLYDLTKNFIEALDRAIDPETGEIDMDIVEAAETDLNVKRVNCIRYAKKLKAEIEAIKAEKQRVEKVLKSHETSFARFKDYLRQSLEKTGEKKVQFGHEFARRQVTESVVVSDASYIPNVMMKHKPATFEPDKTQIKKALKDGVEIKGVSLVPSEFVVIG